MLSLWCLLLLLPASRLLGDLPIYGDDHSSHLAAIQHLLRLMAGGQTDLFCPTFNLGFPMYLYYQPLPHLTVALVHLASFGLLSAQAAFNLTLVALWCLYPLAVYAGARRLGVGDLAALAGALLAPLVSSSLNFGATLHSVMGLGLFTQTFALVLMPLCLGWTWQALHGRPAGWSPGACLAAAGLLVLVWLSHAFYGLVAGTAAVVMALVLPSRLRVSLPRLALVGGVTLASLLFWLLPLLRTRGAMGGWPWGGVDRWQGYGALRVAAELVQGQLLDHGRLPLISLCLAAGVLLAALRWRRRPEGRALLLAWGLFLMFLMGRRSFGHLVDIQPANLELQLFRYIGPVHLLAVLLAGCGLAWSLQRVARRGRLPWTVVALLGLALLAPVVLERGQRALELFRDLRSYQVSHRDLTRAARAIRRSRAARAEDGRIYSHGKTGQGSHLVAALLGAYSPQPMGQSYGVGMHDSLGFYFLEYLDPLDATQLALFNFRWVVSRPDSPYGRRQAARGNPPLVRSGSLQVHRVAGDHGYFLPVEIDHALLGAPRQTRLPARKWLRGGGHRDGRFGLVVPDLARVPARITRVLREDQGRVQVRRDGRWRPLGVWPRLPGPSAPGRVLAEQAGLNRFEARVRMERPAALALKVAYHPYWKARVDGQPAETLMLSPAFLGLRLPAGDHQVLFRFRNPLYQKVLLLLTALGWLAAGVWLLRKKRSSPPVAPAP